LVARYSLNLRAERSVAKTKRLLLLFALFLFGCSSVSSSPKPAPTAAATLTPKPSATAAPTSIPEYVTKIRNAKYQLGISDTLLVVQLKDGKFEQGTLGGTDYVSVNVTDFVAAGDLNNDGRDEIAALVAENYGGSGTFVFLAVYADVSGTLTFQTSILVDDRPMLNALSIKDGEIFVDAIIHGASDPMCCPTLKMTRRYQLVASNQLTMTDFSTFTIDGKPRTITIDAPVNGTQADSSVQFKGSVTIAPFENNLVYRVYDLVGVELASGSIPVTAAQPGGPGTFNAAVSLGNILSGASVRVQIQDVNAADGSLLAMNSVELVVK
jgi:Immunoglobulin-like domain of bacterial spore germination